MAQQHDTKIIEVLRDASQPLSIDAVRLRAGIRSWDTARAMLLELLSQKKIEGLKSSKSWVFWLKPTRVGGGDSLE